MDPQGVEVFDGTDDDHIVGPIPHDLQLIFLPAQGGLFEHDLGDQAGVEACFGDLCQFLPIVGDTAARPAQGKGGADDDGKADLGSETVDIVHGPGEAAAGGTFRPIRSMALRNFSRSSALWITSREAPIISTPYRLSTPASATATAVLRPVCPPGWGEGRRALPGDDPGHCLRGDGFDIGPVRRLRVGHDGGRIGIDEDDLVAFLFRALQAWVPSSRTRRPG